METWITVLSSAGASTIVGVSVMWLCREWISARLKKSIQHEYDVKLEGYKAGYTRFLTENEIRFSRWHEEKLKAIKEVYGHLATASYYLTCLLTSESDPKWQPDQNLKLQVRKNLADKYAAAFEPCLYQWLNNRLFIEGEEDKIIGEFILKMNWALNIYTNSINNNDVSILQKDGPEILKELDMVMNRLRNLSQNILQGKDDSRCSPHYLEVKNDRRC